MQIHSILKRTLFFLHLSLFFFSFPFPPQPNHRNHDMLRLLANTDTTPTSSTKVIGENIGPLLPAYGVISSYRRVSRFTYLYTRDTMCQILLLALRSIALNLTNDICIRDQISPDTGQSQTIFPCESRGSQHREILRKIISTYNRFFFF